MAGCAGEPPEARRLPPPEGDPVAGGELTVEFWPDNAAFSCVDPFQTYWIEHRQVIRNVADSLTDQDPETGEIVPWLATDWEVSPDGLTYTFNLRDDVTFSDGTAFTADSVVLALESAKATLAAVPGRVRRRVHLRTTTSSTAVDEDTVEVQLLDAERRVPAGHVDDEPRDPRRVVVRGDPRGAVPRKRRRLRPVRARPVHARRGHRPLEARPATSGRAS